jgi:polar amino acid transport system substrate-binding protein
MTHDTRRIAALLNALVLTVVVAACSGSSSAPPAPAPTPPAAAAASTTKPSAPAASPVAAASPLAAASPAAGAASPAASPAAAAASPAASPLAAASPSAGAAGALPPLPTPGPPLAPGAAASASNPLQLVQVGQLTVATQDVQAGFTQVDAAGTRTGFAIDLTNEIAKRLGLPQPAYTAMSLTALLPAVGSDQYDMGAIGLQVTDERRQTIDYSEPYYWGFAGLLVRKDNSFPSLDNMAGKDVAALRNTAQEQTLQQSYPRVNEKAFDNQSQALAALRGGQVDGFLVGGADAETYATEDPTLAVSQTLPSPNPTAFPLAKGKIALANAVNQQLSAIIQDGTYKQLYAKYFAGPILPQMLQLFPSLR